MVLFGAFIISYVFFVSIFFCENVIGFSYDGADGFCTLLLSSFRCEGFFRFENLVDFEIDM